MNALPLQENKVRTKSFEESLRTDSLYVIFTHYLLYVHLCSRIIMQYVYSCYIFSTLIESDGVVNT
jgi:hypothetical protein